MNEKDISLVREVLGAIVNTGEWSDTLLTDPQIKAADAAFWKLMESVEDGVSGKLSDAHSHVVSAYCDAAIMYGMRVANTLREGVANQTLIAADIQKQLEAMA